MPINVGPKSRTPEEQAAFDQHKTAKAAMRQFNAALDDLENNWSGMTAGAKSEALRTMVLILAKVVRYVVINQLKV